jgi:hypothetical protein
MSRSTTTTINSTPLIGDYPVTIKALENYLNGLKNFNETLGELTPLEKRTAYYVQCNMMLEIGAAMMTSEIDRLKREYRDAHPDINLEDRNNLINDLRVETKSMLSILRLP